jgi:shikimate kinase
MNLFLIGYRATGKSAVAEAISRRIGAPWVDADDEIARRAGKSIAELFSQDGETAFRDLESEVVKEIASRDGCVISLGGGAVLREENRQAIRSRGKTVWLKASVATIQRRLLADPKTAANRPSLTSRGLAEEVEHVLAARTPIYAACADYTVAVDDKSPDAIADEILALLDLQNPLRDPL